MLLALDRASGTEFESFVNEFYPAVIGVAYVPLGGISDGGADGLIETATEAQGRSGQFLQASTELDSKGKIRRTVERLREVGRDPKVLTYATSRVVRRLDLVEEELERELGVTIRIRDAEYLARHINDSLQTQGAFNHYLRHQTEYLEHVGGTSVLPASPHVATPAVYVFLRQELERRGGDVHLLNAVTDSLVLWALEGTDPDEGRFMSTDDVSARIVGEIPTAGDVIGDLIRQRLVALSTKDNPTGRLVRWHRKDDVFCLPFETRRGIADENQRDESLRLAVLRGFEERIERLDEGSSPEDVRACSELALRSIQLAYEREGLEFAHFLEESESQGDFPTIADCASEAMDERGVNASDRGAWMVAVLGCLRGAFYASAPEEREYFGKLARTYALLFTLKAEPRLVRFFEEMAGDFYLFVGADQLVRALSERYLPEPDQMTRNALRLAAEAGATLVLTDPVIEELVSHLRGTDIEFRNFFEPIESNVSLEIARNAPKILIRAYFYARLNPDAHSGAPADWQSYIAQFCSVPALRSRTAFEEIRRYLVAQFRMRYVTTAQLEALVDMEEVKGIAKGLGEIKQNETLALHDALLAAAVYGTRHDRGELSSSSPFGYRTWWLTDEARILKYTKDLVKRNGNARYMMRPDFLVNFLALAPSVASVRESFRSVFPTLLGVRLAKRMDESAFHRIMQSVDGWNDWEDGRREAEVARLSDALKADFEKRYLKTTRESR